MGLAEGPNIFYWVPLSFKSFSDFQQMIFCLNLFLTGSRIIIINISSSKSHQKNRLSFQREFKKLLPNTFIYESILLKIHMNANIMDMQLFNILKYNIKGY